MNRDILDFIEENDVKFIKLGFCNPLGTPKNISIMASELKNAFEKGIPFDASVMECFSNVKESDLLLFPDEKTLSLLPWRPSTSSVLRFYCDIKYPSGKDFYGDSRKILKDAVRELESFGFQCKIGTECEFYLFKTDEFEAPTLKPLDQGGYLDIAPLDKGEDIRREICLCLEEMGLNPESSFHKAGPGQNEINFTSSDPLLAADNIMTFKSTVKSIVARNGLFASFAPKPFLNESGNSMHINISLLKDGVNLFKDKKGKNYKYAENFIGGVLEKIEEITLFLNPNNNSYERLGSYSAPKYISWSAENLSQLIRVPNLIADKEYMQLRSPDPTMNPYVAFALILRAGIYGIKNNIQLPEAININLEKLQGEEKLKTLPLNLKEAVKSARNSEFLKEYLDSRYLEEYIKIKEMEAEEFEGIKNKKEYFLEKYFHKL